MKHLMVLGMLVGGPLMASQIQVSMFFIGGTNPGFFTFSVDGVTQQLLCDQFFPNVTSLVYTSDVATLSDLSNTQLLVNGDSEALRKYQQVAILDLLAYGNPSLAADVVRAARIIVDGSGPNPPGTQQLLDFVRMQDPTNYDLSAFRIFTSPRNANGDPITQEITGFNQAEVPEPRPIALLSTGLLVLFGFALRKRTPASLNGP